jgi:hypothetical protein
VACHADGLPGRQLAIDLGELFLILPAHLCDLRLEPLRSGVDRRDCPDFARHGLDEELGKFLLQPAFSILETLLKLGQGLFKVELIKG